MSQANDVIVLDLQMAYSPESAAETAPWLPSEPQLLKWTAAALQGEKSPASEITIRIVNNDESQSLNRDYRDKDKPTNVLSFPSELPDFIALEEPHLGDLVIAADIVAAEAEQQNKTCEAHWAHMVVHGCLHLQGYDHINDDDAEQMEALEIQILEALGYANPYVNPYEGEH